MELVNKSSRSMNVIMKIDKWCEWVVVIMG